MDEAEQVEEAMRERVHALALGEATVWCGRALAGATFDTTRVWHRTTCAVCLEAGLRTSGLWGSVTVAVMRRRLAVIQRSG